MEPVMTVEIVLPDGTSVRWGLMETDDRTIDRTIQAVESVLGPADTIKA